MHHLAYFNTHEVQHHDTIFYHHIDVLSHRYASQISNLLVLCMRMCVCVCARVCVRGCVCLYVCVNACTSVYPPGYSHEHKPETLMIGRQYYAYWQQEVTICTSIEVNTYIAKCSMICKLFVTPSMHRTG